MDDWMLSMPGGPNNPNAAPPGPAAQIPQLGPQSLIGGLPAYQGAPSLPSGPLNASNPTAYVTSLYQSILGRAPDQGGLTNWINQLKGGMSPQAVAQAIGQSPEALQHMATTGQAYMNQVAGGGTPSAPAPQAATSGSSTGGSSGGGGSGGFDLTSMLQGITQFAPGQPGSPVQAPTSLNDMMSKFSNLYNPQIPTINFGLNPPQSGRDNASQQQQGPGLGYNTSGFGGLPPSTTGF